MVLRFIISMSLISGLALASAAPSVAAGHHKSYRSGPQVKGFVARRGGYSYEYAHSINTYGNTRTNNGGADVFRDPSLDRQTNSGPFDHGFFFDSGLGSHGGDSPYMH